MTPSEQVTAGLVQLRDALMADVPLARTREEHIRVSARAHQAAQLASLALEPTATSGSASPEPGLEPSHGGGERSSRAYPSI
jgi:hypothetical protein